MLVGAVVTETVAVDDGDAATRARLVVELGRAVVEVVVRRVVVDARACEPVLPHELARNASATTPAAAGRAE